MNNNVLYVFKWFGRLMDTGEMRRCNFSFNRYKVNYFHLFEIFFVISLKTLRIFDQYPEIEYKFDVILT